MWWDWLTPLAVTFGVIALAEMGDKTQLVAISMSSRYGKLPVFLGAILGLSIISLVGILFGALIFSYIPVSWIQYAAGIVFILFGVWTLLQKEKANNTSKQAELQTGRSVSLTTLGMILLAEMGDKTQLAVITLTAEYRAPLQVFIGSLLAFCLITLIGVVIGDRLSQRVSVKKVRIASAVLFIILGVFFLVQTVYPNIL